MKKKFILVPDIHGCDFWKKALPFVDGCERVIFLGDYHDPYSHEGISKADSIQNFMDIIEFAKQHPDKVELLLGNHDLSYYNRGKGDNWSVGSDRFDWDNQSTLRSLFRTNHELFRMAAYVECPEGIHKFLFSHAGVNPGWLKGWNLIKDYNPTETPAEAVFIHIDNLFQAADEKFIESLGDVSHYRGGYTPYGSMVWADCDEFNTTPETPYIQVFGHTQQLNFVGTNIFDQKWEPGKPKVLGDNNVCLDCHQCFFIDENGDIRNLETEEKIF